MSGLIGGVFMAEKKSKYFFYSSICGAAVSALLTYPCICFWGLMGVPVAVSLSFLCMTIVRLRFAWKHINQLEIGYFIIVMIAYLGLIVVYELDLGNVVNIAAFVFSCLIVIYMSRKEIATLLKVLPFKKK